MSKSRPILFSAAMVRAILDGRKTQTRRICKARTQNQATIIGSAIIDDELTDLEGFFEGKAWLEQVECPYGQPGDTLWVKETWRTDGAFDRFRPLDIQPPQPIKYECDDESTGIVAFDWGRIRQSIFMRKWMSRITLEITGIRVERLQDISEEDAKAEGCASSDYVSAKEAYSLLWDSINGPGSWAENPFVWVVTFKSTT